MVIELSEKQSRHVWPEMQAFDVGIQTLTEADRKLYFKNKVEFFSSMKSQQSRALVRRSMPRLRFLVHPLIQTILISSRRKTTFHQEYNYRAILYNQKMRLSGRSIGNVLSGISLRGISIYNIQKSQVDTNIGFEGSYLISLRLTDRTQLKENREAGALPITTCQMTHR